MMILGSCKRLSAFLVSVSILGVVAPTLSTPVSAYIFLGPDTDTSICANIGSAQHYVRDYPINWPSYGTYQYEGGLTNWFCRTDTGQRTLPSRVWTNTIPVGTPVVIGKQDIEHFSGSGTFSRDLSKVEWDLDGNGSFEVQDAGPWVTAQGTQNEQVDSTVTTWTTRARYFEATYTPQTVGNSTIQMRVTWTDGATVTSSGVFTAVADTVSAGVSRTSSLGGSVTTGPVLTGSDVYLSAASSTSLSGYFSKFEWDLNGDGTYEIDKGSDKSLATTFSTPGFKTIGVRVTSRGGSTSTTSTIVEVRQAPPSGESGISILDGAAYTNSKSVKLNLAWPEYATEARISNDGGFAASKTKTVSLSELVDWELDDSLAGIYTKVVYVRFSGSGIDNTKTYSDDIILDSTPPSVSTASGTSAVVPSSSVTAQSLVSAKKRNGVVLRVKASDRLSGVGSFELKTSSKGKIVSVRAGSPSAKSHTVKVKTRAKKIWIRSVDRAGNKSRWIIAKVK
jgi:hypothetical protein